MRPGEADSFPPPLVPGEPSLRPIANFSPTRAWAAISPTAWSWPARRPVLSLGFNVTAGYAFAKLRFAGRDLISSCSWARW